MEEQSSNYAREPESRSLHQTAKLCNILSFLCKIAFYAIVAWSGMVLVIMCWSLTNATYVSDLPAYAFLVPLLYALYSANFCLIPKLLERMLADIAQERTPFTLQNVRRLRIIAAVLAFYALLERLLAVTESNFILSIQNLSIQVDGFINDFAANAGTSLDLFPLVIAAVFFALSYVFQYGVLLQQESDETL